MLLCTSRSTLFPYTTLFRSFSVMDDRAIRFERDRNRFEAFAIMYSPVLARDLSVRFDEMISEAGGVAEPSGQLVAQRSEEHTSELQSHSDLVCRLLLEKKKK